jgi:Protein of unknown function (DUF4233)
MRTLCASTLIGEAFVIGLAGLVAMNLSGYGAGTVWAVCGAAMALCVLLCALVTRPGGVVLGWLLQAGLVASGFVVPMMWFLGVSFAALWWAAVHFGRKIDDFKRQQRAQVA